jgi:N-acetylornithine carbamoyltransferase
VIHAFARHATVPVINMETITHPCQELALALTLQEKLGRSTARRCS